MLVGAATPQVQPLLRSWYVTAKARGAISEESMQTIKRSTFRYTAAFCEENIWWAAHDLAHNGYNCADLQVLLFTNPSQQVLMFNQSVVPKGAPTLWDYHVVLQLGNGASAQILDFDTRLDFPVPLEKYVRESFPSPNKVPDHYRAWVRVIPARSYLQRFDSDRSHMRGVLPDKDFPKYPPIRATALTDAIQLSDYRDLQSDLSDGSRVLSLQNWLAEAGLFQGK